MMAAIYAALSSCPLNSWWVCMFVKTTLLIVIEGPHITALSHSEGVLAKGQLALFEAAIWGHPWTIVAEVRVVPSNF